MYDGPVVDAHTHLWDLEVGRYPWLAVGGSFGPPGRLDPLKGISYTLDDYRRDVAGHPVVASVHVEALWDPDDDPVAETRWLDSIPRDDLLVDRYVAGVRFGRADTNDVIRRHLQHPRVRGVRQAIGWTPDPARRAVERPGITTDPAWRSAIPLLVESDLLLELLLYPWQGDDVAALADDHPDLTIVIDHMASPIDQDAEGLARWRRAVELMGARPNVHIKASAAAAYIDRPSADRVAPFLRHVVRHFGPERVMFGSDFPVGRLVGWTYGEYLDLYRSCFDELGRSDQQLVFYDNARALYDLRV